MKLNINKLNKDLNDLELDNFYFYGFYFGHKLWHHKGIAFSRQCSYRTGGNFINDWRKSDYEMFEIILNKLFYQFDKFDFSVTKNTWCGTQGYHQYDICQLREALDDNIEKEITNGFRYIEKFLDSYAHCRCDLQLKYEKKINAIKKTIKTLKKNNLNVPSDLNDLIKVLELELKDKLSKIKIKI